MEYVIETAVLRPLCVCFVGFCHNFTFLVCFVSFQERPRPTFAALAPAVERNPVTGLLEPYFPEEKRFPRIVSGIAIVICMVRIAFCKIRLENLVMFKFIRWRFIVRFIHERERIS